MAESVEELYRQLRDVQARLDASRGLYRRRQDLVDALLAAGETTRSIGAAISRNFADARLSKRGRPRRTRGPEERSSSD